MTLSARLKLVLLVNDVTVAESEDADLWQSALAAVNGSRKDAAHAGETAVPLALTRRYDTPISRMAAQIGVTPERLVGACGPTAERPCIHLDTHAWAAFRRNVPTTGKNAVSGGALAATLLLLWARHQEIAPVNTTAVQQVLNGIGAESSQLNRSIRRCPWLQMRQQGQIVINPAEINRAEQVARAFCDKAPLQPNGTEKSP